MNAIQALILSIVEGVTEFLPISSTGHLNLTRVLLGIPKTEFFTTFEIFIQLGAILAVVVLYFKVYYKNFEVWKKVLAAFIPTAIIGLILGKFIKHFLTSNEYITLIALFVGGILLVLAELYYKEEKATIDKIEDIPYPKTILIGLCQAIAVIPGASRSATTIIGSLFLGVGRKTAVEFSFLLAVPTMLAATIFDLKDANFSFSSNEILLLTIGFVGSFVTAVIAIKFMLRFIKKYTFIPFGIYRIIVALIFWIFIIR